MARFKLVVDTNIIIDYLGHREPFYERSRLLMLCGSVGVFELWASASQVTDALYVLSNGGRKSDMQPALDALKGVCSFVQIYAAGSKEVTRMLSTTWDDPEDALLHEVALALQADAIITRNAKDFTSSLVKVFSCEEFFEWLRLEHNSIYAEVQL